MRYIVHAHVAEIARDELQLNMADLRKRLGFSWSDLHQRSMIVDRDIRAISDQRAKAIDDLVGRVVSFAPPKPMSVAHGAQEREFDSQRIRNVIRATGIAAASLSRMLGRNPGWLYVRLTEKKPLRLSQENYAIVDQLCSSVESPVYAEGESIPAPCAIATTVAHENIMPNVARAFCVAVKTPTVEREVGAANLVPKWRKILQVLERLSQSGTEFVDENVLVVETWRAYPKDFGLRGYELQYPEAREIRSKLVSKPLSRHVERNESQPAQWAVKPSGVALVSSPRNRETRRFTRALLACEQTCCNGPLGGCDDTIVRPKPPLAEPAPITTRKPATLAPFIAAAKKKARS